MNKFFTKIAGLSLGLAMAIGVGVAVGSKEAKVASAADATMQYTGSTTTNMTASGNASTVGLDSSVFTVDSTKQGSNFPGLNKSGYIALYAGGSSTITVGVVTGYTINSITITYTSSTYSPATVLVGGNEVTGSSDTYTIGASSFVLKNAKASGQVRMTRVDIDYSTQASGYTVTYKAGSGTGSDYPDTNKSGSYTILGFNDCSFTAPSTYAFSHWSVVIGTGSAVTKNPGDSITVNAATTITAQYVLGKALIYNGNGSDGGSTATTYVKSGESQTVSSCGFTRDGYLFSHWNTATDDTGISYDPNDTISNFASDLTLYAIWEEVNYVVVDAIVTSGNMTGNNDANSKFGLSATDWSIVGTKQSASNLPGFGSDGTTRLYGNASGGNYIVFKTLKAHRSIVKISIEFNGSYSTGAIVKQGEGTSGTTITASEGFYTFAASTTAFTLINTNSSTTQVRFDTIHIYFEDEAVSTPEINLTSTPSTVGIGTGTASFTVNYANLTTAFSVSTDASYVTASYTGALGTGSATVTLSGVAVTNSTTITVSSTGATSQSFTVAVEVLPIIDSNLSSMAWGSTAYAASPHILTWNTSYTFGVSAGQFNGGIGYVGTNSNNKDYSTVDGASWTMTGADYSSLNSAMSIADGGSSYWSTYGSAFRMLNFGVSHPTSFSVTAGTVGSTTDKYYLFASTDSGSSWTYLTGNDTITAGTAMTWSNSSTYASESNLVQFAFVFTGTTAGKTISDVTVKIWADSYATTKVLDSISVSGTPKTTYKVGESFDLNGATVKAHYTDSTTYPDEDVSSSVEWTSITHGTTQVTGSYGGKEVTVNVTVTDEGTVYKKVLSTDELIVGAKVIIGTSNGGYTAGAQGSTNKNRNSEAAGGSYGYYEDGDIENWSVNTTVFTIGKTETGYTFHDGTGYLYAASSSDNVLRVENELDENHNGEWSISISDGVATIVSQGEHTHNTMNGNGTAFSVYASPTVAISLYSDVAQTMLNGFGETYLHMTDYTSQSGYCSDNSHHYYLTAKEALVAMGSAYIDELQSNGALDAYQARYEAWARACGDTSPYAGSGIVKSSSLLSMMNSSKNVATTIAIIAISAVSLAAIGGYFLFRKKKED